MLTLATSPRRLARAVGMFASMLALAAILTPAPAGAAPSGSGLHKSPGTSLNTGTCRPKWPYVVLTCVA